MGNKGTENISGRGVTIDISVRNEGRKCLDWKDLPIDEANDAIDDVSRKFGRQLRRIGGTR